jgi:O-acetyl-ADP-ribose deacetylase (regulator of RNase III)
MKILYLFASAAVQLQFLMTKNFSQTEKIMALLSHKMLQIIECDILQSESQYIVHQCNCTGNRSWGLAAKIFKKWKSANIYSGKNKVETRTPGEIIVREKIINLLGQIHPGGPSDGDTSLEREKFFAEGLEKIAALQPVSVAFPFGIGCGLAKGDWNNYMKMLEDFAQKKSTNFSDLVQKFRLSSARKIKFSPVG